MTNFFKDRKVLVTGGTGFVGSHFVETLIGSGAHVRVPIHQRPLYIGRDQVEAINADLTDPKDCLRACDGVDYVVHAAGGVGSASMVASGEKMSSISLNLILTVQMLQAAWSKGVKRFLLFSSSTGYPEANHPVKEDEFWSAPPHPSYLGYGWMRRYLECLGAFVHTSSDTKISIVRPSAVYGERDNFDPAASHVLAALIRRAVAGENPYVVWGNADVVRDFLHISDLVSGSLLMLEKYAEGDPVNIGYGEAITIGEVVTLILELTQGKNMPDVVYDESKPTTAPHRSVDISKAKRILGFQPSLTLRQGLQKTIEWYRAVHT